MSKLPYLITVDDDPDVPQPSSEIYASTIASGPRSLRERGIGSDRRFAATEGQTGEASPYAGRSAHARYDGH